MILRAVVSETAALATEVHLTRKTNSSNLVTVGKPEENTGKCFDDPSTVITFCQGLKGIVNDTSHMVPAQILCGTR